MGRRPHPLAEQREQERTLKVSEASASPVEARRVAADYVHTVHPDTGLDVVFVPGETLPAWVELEPEG
ncbi:hypothetical protein [Agromyces sp. CCNWLW203]|uniref:hypothetical protein n=1 Tax=Agromyces sp. CCNWLW203 TaxID=3112842 RepID=UPI002F962F29